MTLKVRMAQNLRRLRLERSLSQTDLANRAGVKPTIIEQMERADYDDADVDLLDQLADALGVDVYVLVAPHPSD